VDRTVAISPESAYLVHDVLEGVFRRGTARSAALLGFRGRAAGKTGTTDGTRDAWFVGYSGDLLALVWVGYDDNARTGLSGATGALPIWVEFMKPDAAPAAAAKPQGLIQIRVCADSGMLATKRCPDPRSEWFKPGSEPDGKCTEHAGRFRRWMRKTFKGED
jgi:penicillin-binding protein 1B